MFKKILLLVALTSTMAAGAAFAQGRAISGDLPWDNDAANPVLQQRLDDMFPDGTATTTVSNALRAERFTLESDRRGLSSDTSEGRRFASRHVVRFVFGCGTRVHVSWQQRDGQVFDVTGRMHTGCL